MVLLPRLPSPGPDQGEAALVAELSKVTQELAWYDEAGVWGLIKAHYLQLIDRELSALEHCPVEEVESHRAVLRTLRHLVAVPDELAAEQARLQEELNV